ncbi:MAG: YicC family protein [Deltaproteobacteria bacterium]|nr:YicC family protein [Deltaproteobacteria bacterium]
MLRSMTGFGRGTADFEDGTLGCEIRSVNHRFCDVKLRASRDLLPLEAGLLSRIRARLGRGSIEVSLRWEKRPSGKVQLGLDTGLLTTYRERLEEIAAHLGVEPRFDPVALSQVEGILERQERSYEPDALRPAAEAAVDAALELLLAMREREGEALRSDLSSRLQLLEAQCAELQGLADGRLEARRERLEARLLELLGERKLDPDRLAMEVALLAEKADVSEEITRLDTHLASLAELLAAEEPVGRRIDFLVQELNREVNTIGSKAQDAELAAKVMDLKAEIERIREQVQNVE